MLRDQARKPMRFAVKESAKGLTNKISLNLYLNTLIFKKGKLESALMVASNALKLYYREPFLWECLANIYRLQAEKNNDDLNLTQKSIMAFENQEVNYNYKF